MTFARNGWSEQYFAADNYYCSKEFDTLQKAQEAAVQAERADEEMMGMACDLLQKSVKSWLHSRDDEDDFLLVDDGFP